MKERAINLTGKHPVVARERAGFFAPIPSPSSPPQRPLHPTPTPPRHMQAADACPRSNCFRLPKLFLRSYLVRASPKCFPLLPHRPPRSRARARGPTWSVTHPRRRRRPVRLRRPSLPLRRRRRPRLWRLERRLRGLGLREGLEELVRHTSSRTFRRLNHRSSSMGASTLLRASSPNTETISPAPVRRVPSSQERTTPSKEPSGSELVVV